MSRELFEDFHESDPIRALDLNCEWPDLGVVAGEAVSVVYRSDKWGDGVIDYVHPFAPMTAAIVPGSEWGDVAIALPEGSLAWLGGLVELQIDTGSGPRNVAGAPDPELDPRELDPLLAYTPAGGSRAQLVWIPGSDVPDLGAVAGCAVVIAGPALDVRSEGIVG